MMVHPTGFAALEVAVHIEGRHILALVAADPASYPSEVVAAFPSCPSEAEAAFPFPSEVAAGDILPTWHTEVGVVVHILPNFHPAVHPPLPLPRVQDWEEDSSLTSLR